MALDLRKKAHLFLNRHLTRIAPSQTDSANLDFSILSSSDEYFRYQEASVHLLKQARNYEDSLINSHSPQPEWFQVKGYCFICHKDVGLYVDLSYGFNENGRSIPNWREHLCCPSCRLNNRSRAALHLFELLLRPAKGANIYITEQTSSLFQRLKKTYPDAIGSEFLEDGTLPGRTNRNGIRHEDLTRLSFETNKLDFILSFDVFEHIFDLNTALEECHRCLKIGAVLFFTVPFNFHKNSNSIRASIDGDGKVTHLLPPEFHGDPLNPDGILCCHDLGWELFSMLRSIGFKDVQACIYWSKEYGYLGKNQCVFLARK
jgi:SAM-dependent methyltransferase